MNNTPTILTVLLTLALLLQLAHSDCTLADSYECTTSLCSNFYWTNGTCQTSATACTVGTQTLSATTCTTCSGLTAATSSST